MFRKLKEKGGSGGPEFLQSHPLPDSRIRAAEQRAAAYKQGRSTP
jgi:predicted Zn-dependent protease